ncbi:porin family protein [Dyadobacter fermentans]|uniref:porin family protein n=1 Tax=Dyadobacter fermentans TaxID=94254 RepID=UPI001CC1B161|nr:porin family protein [Dyadobacter fermentans]MBZ1362908.1 PorT family protein [Dyadobacter fermentans]
MRLSRPIFKVALSAVACYLISHTAQAQLSLGLKGGVNFSTMNAQNSSISNFDDRIAPNFAVVFNYRLGPAFSIQAEPGFSSRGATVRPNQPEPGIIITPGSPYQRTLKGVVKVNYFELPIVAQYRPRLTERLEAIISAGPEVRFRTGPQKLETTTATYVSGEKKSEVTITQSYSGNDAVSTFDAGFTAGAGVAYPIGRLKVFLEGRYHLGLYNLASDNNNRGDDAVKIHNRGASVFVGVTVPILK